MEKPGERVNLGSVRGKRPARANGRGKSLLAAKYDQFFIPRQ
jgi:hypothetical protein